MAKATINFGDSTTALIEGTPEEVAKLIELLRGHPPYTTEEKKSARAAKKKGPKKSGKAALVSESQTLVEIVNVTKNCDESNAIEKQVLDRTSQVDRVLLPLYIIHEHFEKHGGLTSGDVAKITKELGIPIHITNAARTLAGTASKYVIADGVRKKGLPVRYKISRKGLHYFKTVLSGGQ